MNYEKMKSDLLKLFKSKAYIMTFDRENLANQVIELVRAQEPTEEA